MSFLNQQDLLSGQDVSGRLKSSHFNSPYGVLEPPFLLAFLLGDSCSPQYSQPFYGAADSPKMHKRLRGSGTFLV